MHHRRGEKQRIEKPALAYEPGGGLPVKSEDVNLRT
jgi:hypothetical protein